MLSAQNQEPSVIDALSGSVSQWYADVDAAMKKSDVVPGTYEYTITPSYGNVGDIQENSSTYVDVTSTRFSLVSIDNSFLELEQEVPITLSKKQSDNHLSAIYYVGYQYAPEAILQYRIYSNSDLIQTVNWANYEWFLMRNSVQPEAKEQSDQFATIEKIRRLDPNVPGVYVDMSKINGDNTLVTVKLKLRIPLNSFLMLKNLKYLPQWAGKLSIEIIPSYKNIVVARCDDPTSPQSLARLVSSQKLNADKQNEFVTAITEKFKDEFNTGFINLNQTTKWHVTVTAASGAIATINDVTFRCNNQTTKNVKIHLAVYMLQMDVFNALASQYVQVPLMFPIQLIESKDYTKVIGANASIDNALTVQLKHADAMFTVFKKDVNSYSCFENPEISYQFNIDGKYFPRQAFDTIEDVRTVNQTLDALNFNNCLTTSLNKDAASSMQPYNKIQECAAGGAITLKTKYKCEDKSNFCIGIPLADSEDFMGGISTAGTVQVQIVGERLSGENNKPGGGIQAQAFGNPVALFTEDAILKIRSMKPPGQPQISFTTASIEQVLAAAGAV